MQMVRRTRLPLGLLMAPTDLRPSGHLNRQLLQQPLPSRRGCTTPPAPDLAAQSRDAERSSLKPRSSRGRGRGRGSGPWRQAGSRKQGAGWKSGTSILDAALARPLEGSSDKPGYERFANVRNSDGIESEAIPERAEQHPQSVQEETEEQAQERHVADARWNAAMKKDASLRPKSKKDYVRGLKRTRYLLHQLLFWIIVPSRFVSGVYDKAVQLQEEAQESCI